MTGFSPEWLALREPADLAARNPGVLAACARAFAAHDELSICDLGAGTGASVRALAGLLPGRQGWALVDDDAAVMAASRAALATWAGGGEELGDRLVLRHASRNVEVRWLLRDLAADPRCWPAGTQLVTASALFDLASAAWLGRFVARLADCRLPLLATLSFDGTIAADPPHPHDRAVIDAFKLHQTRDKGFGAAAGPEAGPILVRQLRQAGYSVISGASPWRLAPGPLREAFLDGVAAAVAETGMVSAAALGSWRPAMTQAGTIAVGHLDLFAEPLAASVTP